MQISRRYPFAFLIGMNSSSSTISVDGILCDPPYGIRAGARKTCSQQGEHPPLEIREGHIPRTEVYEPDDVLVDLLDMASRTLVMGGRIAYLLPTFGE